MKPEKFLENFSSHLKNTIARSISIAASLSHPRVKPVHILLALAEETGAVASEILFRLKLDTKIILKFLEEKKIEPVVKEKKAITTTLPELSNETKKILERAMLIAYEREQNYIGTEHLLAAIAKNPDLEVSKLFSIQNINFETVLEEVENVLQSTNRFPNAEDIEETMDQMQDMIEDNPPPMPPLPSLQKNKSKKSPGATAMFATNLTDKKIAKNSDPVISREEEIERLIHILSRRTKNNPVLLGEPGVGKTAIVEGLAKRIVAGDVPDILKKKKILSLDLTLLIAGTIYRGEFESRLKQIIDEVSGKPDYILFIDEIHNIIGAGSNQGTMDAANILKPALARGKLHCIGATTLDEYKKHITSDPALERRFQPIYVEEPSTEEAKEILEGIKPHYEEFHNVKIDKDAIAAAVEYSERYIHDNFLPDKAIDLIDEASASVRTKRKTPLGEQKLQKLELQLEDIEQQKEEAIKHEKFDLALTIKNKEKEIRQKIMLAKKQSGKTKNRKDKVGKADVAEVVARRIDIPKDFLLKNEWEQLSTIEENLKKNIVGQDPVINNLVKSLKQSHLKLHNNKKPFASFLFVGPSGVGKTALAKQLALELFKDEKALVKLDMSEFAESHGVSKLLGSPAGYIGHKERNRFTDELKKRPYAVLLFDEFDRAHKDVQKLLLQMLDEGELTDSAGKKIYLHHSIIVLTSNVGAELYKSAGIGFGNTKKSDNQEIHKSVMHAIKTEFGNPLTARIQNIIPFYPLESNHVETIIKNNIEEMSQKLKSTQNLNIVPDNKVIKMLAQNAYTEDTGVRNLDNIVQNVLHELLINILQKDKRKKNYTLTHSANQYKLI